MQAQSLLSVHLHLWFHSNWVKMYVWNSLICCLTITNPGPRKICEGFILYFWRKFWPWDFLLLLVHKNVLIYKWQHYYWLEKRSFCCAAYCKDGRKATLSSNTVTDYFNFVWCVFWRYTDIYGLYGGINTGELLPCHIFKKHGSFTCCRFSDCTSLSAKNCRNLHFWVFISLVKKCAELCF